MQEFMFQSGKIYVVVAVIAVIMIGIFVYLFKLDKKVKKLEEEVKDKE
ncbi:MAG: CcmD family protein [Flavobacteriales bacterium]